MLNFLLSHWALVLCCALSLIGYIFAELKHQSGLKALSTQETVALINEKNVFILDVRTKKELEAANKLSLKNAFHAPLGNLLECMKHFKKQTKRPVLVVCAKGNRAHAAWSILKASDFDELYTLEGGIAAWQEQG